MQQIADLYDSPREGTRGNTAVDRDAANTQELLQQALDRIRTLEVQLRHERDMRQHQQQTLNAVRRDGQVLVDRTDALMAHARHQEETQREQEQPQNITQGDEAHSRAPDFLAPGVTGRHNPVDEYRMRPQHAAEPHPQQNRFKVDPPKPFDGKTLDGTALESWLYQMNLYFTIETSLPDHLRASRAALLLTGNAATWFRAQRWDPTTLDWHTMQQAMRQTFKPVDHQYRARDRLRQCQQTGSVLDYTAAFRARLLECTDVSDAEALDRYVAGLKQGTRDWVLIHDPSSLHEAARWAERYDNTYYARGKANAASQQSTGGPMPLGRRQQPQGSRSPGSGKPYSQGYRPQYNQRPQPQPTQQRPQSQNMGYNKQKFEGQCFICGRPGHKASECKLKPRNQNARSNQAIGDHRAGPSVQNSSGNE